MGVRVHQNYVVLMSPVVIMMVIAAVVPSLGCSSSGLQYSVGDSLWTIPPFPDYFSNWSSSHFFKIGDSLVFDFETGRFDLIQVSRQEYDLCSSWRPLKIIYGGPAIVPLMERGVFYFLCNLSNYCSLGQKIVVTVHDCHEPNPLSLSPSPSPAPVVITPASSPSTPGSNYSPTPSSVGNGRDSPEIYPSAPAPAPEKSAAIMSISSWGFRVCLLAFFFFLGL